jgi:hypothetical protein
MILARNRAVLALALSFALSALGADGLFAQIKENLDLPFDAVGEQEEEEESPEVVVFYNTNLEGDGFFYIIDRSRSMQDAGELPKAKQETSKNVREFSDRVYFGIFFFDANLLKFPSNGQPAKANAGMKGAALSFIQSTPPGGGTCLKEALMAALRMANMCKAKRKVIVYLSDGGGHCNGQDPSEYLRQTLGAVSSANVQRVKINTIGVLDLTPDGETFMRNLASQNGGSYTRIN